jgi:hypothetical protein
MNDTVQAALDREIAKLTKVQDPAAPPLGYGRDLSCVTDCDWKFSEVDPMSPLGVGQALLRRLITVRGTLDDDVDYGLDVRGYLNRGTTAADLRSLASRIEGECEKDDRVLTVEATVVTPSMRTLRIGLRVGLQSPEGRSFDLVFSVTDATVLIETLST